MVRKPKRRNPYAAAVRRLGHKVKPSKKIYTRKGRSKDRRFGAFSRPSVPHVAGCRGASRCGAILR